jgi:regulator of replication initiation timing
MMMEENESLKVKNKDLKEKLNKYEMKKFEFLNLFDD